jgi:hypothetical protein
MVTPLLILTVEALVVYAAVLGAHALRHRYGSVYFYSIMGAIAAIMSWVTDAGVMFNTGWATFNIGSTIFYTALLLGVFVVYVVQGPQPTRLVMTMVVVISIMMPAIAYILHAQHLLSDGHPLAVIPSPSLRINSASVFTTLLDLVFLAVVWEFLGQPRFRVRLWMRTYLTLLGVMWFDVLLFTTGAFWGTPDYVGILTGSLISRLLISSLAFPLLYVYLHWQSKREDIKIENRPVLSIIGEMDDISAELSEAQREIEKRKLVEAELRKALSEVKTLQGMIPICAGCKKVRDDQGYWERIESYLKRHSDASFTHGMCPTCMETYYPEAGKR